MPLLLVYNVRTSRLRMFHGVLPDEPVQIPLTTSQPSTEQAAPVAAPSSHNPPRLVHPHSHSSSIPKLDTAALRATRAPQAGARPRPHTMSSRRHTRTAAVKLVTQAGTRSPP